MGPLIDANSVERYKQAIETAKRAGGTVLCGDKTRSPGNFVEPTIIRAQADWPIVQTETFAPILYLIEFKSLDDAIAMHNSSHHGLSSAIFTDNLQHAERFLSAAGQRLRHRERQHRHVRRRDRRRVRRREGHRRRP